MLFQLCKNFMKEMFLDNYFNFFRRNPDGTTSAVININTNYINFVNNATQNALNNIGAVVTILYNTSK